MREIKFRAINAKNEIIYGLPYTDGTNDTIYFNKCSNRLCWRNEDGASCNQPYINGTLEQYTGLKDKNGVEIYEGDILKFNYGIGGNDYIVYHEVYYENERARYSVNENAQGFPMGGQSLGGYMQEYLEVAGNIHQNADLLK